MNGPPLPPDSPPPTGSPPGGPTPAAGAPPPPVPGSASNVPHAPRLNDPSPRRVSRPVGPVLAVAGGTALAIGSFLEAASTSGVVTAEKSYFDGDGPLTLAAGVVVGALAILLFTRVLPSWCGWLVTVFGALGALIALADIVDVLNRSDQVEPLGGSIVVGPALWVCLAGGVTALAGGVVSAVLTTDDPSS